MSGNERRAWIVDLILAVVLAAVSAVSAVFLSSADARSRPADALCHVLIVLACGVLAVRRRHPVPVLAVSTTAVSGYLLLSYPYGPVMISVAVAVYTVCRRIRTAPALVLSAGAFVLLVAHIFVHPAALPGVLGLIPAAAWIAIPATVGIAGRLVGEARARERAEMEQRLREQERLRVSQEMHDVVGHGLAAIQMQADIALHLAESKPEQGITALRAISDASSAALAELREALREVEPTATKHQPGQAAAAGLAHLDELCSRMRASGAEVALRAAGTPGPLPSAVDLAVYRIVQESLTNIVKHAKSPRAAIELEHRPDAIAFSVSSPHDGTAIEEGFGIRGMRRRAAELGGTVTIEAGDEFTVSGWLPVDVG